MTEGANATARQENCDYHQSCSPSHAKPQLSKGDWCLLIPEEKKSVFNSFGGSWGLVIFFIYIYFYFCVCEGGLKSRFWQWEYCWPLGLWMRKPAQNVTSCGTSHQVSCSNEKNIEKNESSVMLLKTSKIPYFFPFMGWFSLFTWWK